MRTLYRERVGARVAVAVCTDAVDGDVHPLHVEPATLLDRQRRTTGRPWTMLDEVHGTDVHEVDAAADPTAAGGVPAWPLAGVGDVLLTGQARTPLAIWAADCAPIALFGSGGTTAVLHAGWKGLAAGVVDVALDAVERRGDTVVVAVLGPVIHPCCYEFGRADLRRVADALGVAPDRLTATTAAGSTALDVPGVVHLALARRGVSLAAIGPCTGCGGALFSHRCRGDLGRHALVAWTEPAGSEG